MSEENNTNDLPWDERITMLSIHPDAASRDDVARLASELMEARRMITEILDRLLKDYARQ
jgi:hypothetical protein